MTGFQNNTFVVLLIITTNQFEILVELNVIVHNINPSADLNSSEIPPLWLSGMSDMDSANLTNITVKYSILDWIFLWNHGS